MTILSSDHSKNKRKALIWFTIFYIVSILLHFVTPNFFLTINPELFWEHPFLKVSQVVSSIGYIVIEVSFWAALISLYRTDSESVRTFVKRYKILIVLALLNSFGIPSLLFLFVDEQNLFIPMLIVQMIGSLSKFTYFLFILEILKGVAKPVRNCVKVILLVMLIGHFVMLYPGINFFIRIAINSIMAILILINWRKLLSNEDAFKEIAPSDYKSIFFNVYVKYIYLLIVLYPVYWNLILKFKLEEIFLKF